MYRLQKSSTVLDGIRLTVTQKKIKLCAVHLKADTPLPLPDSVLDFPPVDFSHSATEKLLQQIDTEENPLRCRSWTVGVINIYENSS